MPYRSAKRAIGFALANDGSIKARVLRSGMWLGFSSVTGSLLSVGRSIVLARLLSPETFGLMGLADIVIRAVETFTRPGIGQALIARQEKFEETSETAFTLLFGRGLLLAAMLFAAAPVVASFYEARVLGPMLQVLSIVFVLGGLNNINLIARQKEIDFRHMTYIGQITAIITTVTTIVVAYFTRSVWALVVGQVVSAGIYALLSYVFIPGKIGFKLNRGVCLELLSYSKYVTASSICLYVANEIDTAVVGKVLGTQQLGYYVVAFTLANLPTTNLSKMAAGIMMPAYSKLQSDVPALGRAFLRTLSVVMLAVVPATAGIVLLAKPFIAVVYGERWVPAALPLQILSVFGLFRALASFSGYLFEGIGRPKVSFYLALFRVSIVGVLIIPMTRLYGLPGAATVMTVGIGVQWFCGLAFLTKHVNIRFGEILEVLFRPMWTTMVMGAVVYSLSIYLDGMNPIGLTTLVLSGVLVYAMLNLNMLLNLAGRR